MNAKRVCLAVIVSGMALCPLMVSAQAPGTADGGAAEVRALIDQGRCAEALALAEKGPGTGPSATALQMAKVDALLCLHRPEEALNAALPLAKSNPQAAFEAGVAAERLGRMKTALELWVPLFDDAAQAPKAYEASVQALVAAGREEEATALLVSALKKVNPPSAGLLKLVVALDKGGDARLSALAGLQGADPAKASSYRAFAQVCRAAGGPLCSETLSSALPAAIGLKERSERLEVSSLSWGGGNSYGRASGNIASGTQGYGAGIKDTATSEGGKAATMSTPPRVVVEVSLDGGKSAPFVLDSLSDVVLVSPKLAKKLDLRRIAPAEYTGLGLGESAQTDWVLLKKVELGPLVFTDVPAKVIDPKADYWDETGGVLPLWLLRHYGLHYDRRHGKLTLYPTGTPADKVLGSGAFGMGVMWYDGKPFASAGIMGKSPCFMQMGTAVVGTYVELGRSDDLGLNVQTSKYGPQRERGLFGLISAGVADRVPLTLGINRIDLSTVLLADLCPEGDVDCAGTLGRNVLDLFDVYLDYQAGVLALKGYEKGL